MMRFAFSVTMLLVVPFAVAAEPKTFPEAKHGKGELRYVDGVPVLTVRGTPAEMGEQFGKLAIAERPGPERAAQAVPQGLGAGEALPGHRGDGRGKLKPGFPRAHPRPRSRPPRRPPTASCRCCCSPTPSRTSRAAWAVRRSSSRRSGARPAARSSAATSTGCRRRASPSTRWSWSTRARGSGRSRRSPSRPIAGVISGMNDAGLCVTINEISIKKSKDKAEFNWKGTPLLLAFRRVLEECATVAEAEKLLREHAANDDVLHDDLRQERRGGVRDHAEEPRSAHSRERRVLLHEPLPHRQAVRGRQVLALRQARTAAGEGRGRSSG